MEIMLSYTIIFFSLTVLKQTSNNLIFFIINKISSKFLTTFFNLPGDNANNKPLQVCSTKKNSLCFRQQQLLNRIELS